LFKLKVLLSPAIKKKKKSFQNLWLIFELAYPTGDVFIHKTNFAETSGFFVAYGS